MLTFEKETQQYLVNYKKQPLFLKQLLISGKFKQAESYLECVLGESQELQEAQFLIKKQYFLELITKRPEDKDTNRVLELLNHFEKNPDVGIFEELCDLLAMKSIKEREEYKDWTVLRGRESCFDHILPILKDKLEDGETQFPREFDYLKCFKGLLLSQKFDFLNEKKLRCLESFEEDRGIVTRFERTRQGEDGYGDLENSRIIDIVNESMHDDAELLSNMKGINESQDLDMKNTSKFEKSGDEDILMSFVEVQQERVLKTINGTQETIKMKKSGLRFNTVSPKIEEDYKVADSYVENDLRRENERSPEVKIYGYSNPQSPSETPLKENSKTGLDDIDKEEEISQLIPSKLIGQRAEFLTISEMTHKTMEGIKSEFEDKKQVNNFLQGNIFDTMVDASKNDLRNIYMSYQSNFASKNFTKKFSSQDKFRVIYEGTDSLPVRGAAFSPDGQYLSIGSNSRILNIYNIQNIIQNYVEIFLKIFFRLIQATMMARKRI